MPYSSVDKPNQYFDTSLWSGTGATQSITSLNFQPDWLWVKSRSTASNHRSQNAVTGVTKGMNPNQTNAEDTLTDCVTSFNSNGFTLGADSQGYVNTSSRTYVGWSWKANGSGVSNTAGTISSTVSANTTSGFSVVGYTGNGTTGATVGHGLGVAPAMIIQKRRDGSIASWRVWHKSIHATSGETNTLFLNTTNANGADIDNISGVSSTTFTTRGTGATNPSGNTCVAYCFAEVKGFSKFGSYTGNGSTDGTFVYTGFKPAYVLLKGSSVSGSWTIEDNKRSPINQMDARLFAEGTDAESSNGNGAMDFLSNGFKFRVGHLGFNQSGSTYIYACFAENPFVSSKGIPCTAR